MDKTSFERVYDKINDILPDMYLLQDPNVKDKSRIMERIQLALFDITIGYYQMYLTYKDSLESAKEYLEMVQENKRLKYDVSNSKQLIESIKNMKTYTDYKRLRDKINSVGDKFI